MDAKLRRLLKDLRTVLGRALAQSSEASRVVREIRQEGWSLYLVVDQQQDKAAGAVELDAGRAGKQPVFKIDGRDLTFLRSIGIDPTRSLR